MLSRVGRVCSAITLVMLVVACGGSGGGGEVVPSPPSQTTPPPTPPNAAPSVSGTPIGFLFVDESYLFQPVIEDADNDPLVISSENLPDWLSLNPDNGEVSGIPGQADVGNWNDITLIVDDGTDETRFSFSVEVRRDDIEKALVTGEYNQVNNVSAYYAAIQDELAAGQSRHEAAIFSLFGLDENGLATSESLTSLRWRVPDDAHLLMPIFGNNTALFYPDSGNPTNEDSVLGIYGQKDEAQVLVLGGNPIYDGVLNSADVNDQTFEFLENAISVLSEVSDPKAQPINVTVAHFNDTGSVSERSEVHDWLMDTHPSTLEINAPGACDGTALDSCLPQSLDLLILSGHLGSDQSATTLQTAVEHALAQGTSILFMAKPGADHDGNDVGFRALDVIPVGFAGDRRTRLNNFDVTDAVIGQLPPSLSELGRIFEQLELGLLDYDLLPCNELKCPSGHGYRLEFQPLLDNLVDRFERYDTHGYDLFDGNAQSYRLDKLLALWADSVRSDVTFPMVAAGFGNEAFLTSALADSIVPYNRLVVSPQSDRGTFGSKTYDGVSTETVIETYKSQQPFRSSGTYAIPGQTVSVSRTDEHSDVNVEIRINSNRSSSVRLFGNSGVSRDRNKEHYNRPLHVASSKLPIEPGETIYLTSPYGGPLHVYADQNDVDITLEFQNVGRHPYWDENTEDATFMAAMAAGEYDWAEISMPHFEIHAPLEAMQSTLDSSTWQPDFDGDHLSALVAGTKDTVDWLNSLAGYRGEGISSSDEISRFAQKHGLGIQPLPEIQHVYVDQATCSTACGGNPYEMDRAYYPYNMTAIHEHGHSLETRDHRFDGWGVHSQTDLYLHYHQYRQILKYGSDRAISVGRSLPYRSMFNLLQDSRNASDPFAYMIDEGPSTWQERQVVMMQILSIAENEGVFDGGWYALSAFHVIEREYMNIENESEWITNAAKLGFAGVSWDDVQSWSNNDWNLAVWSHILERDMTDYFEMWGLGFTDDAKSVVSARGYPSQPLVYYAHSGDSHELGLSADTIAIDGVSEWSGKTVATASKTDAHVDCDHEH